jgi:hypothetical protein
MKMGEAHAIVCYSNRKQGDLRLEKGDAHVIVTQTGSKLVPAFSFVSPNVDLVRIDDVKVMFGHHGLDCLEVLMLHCSECRPAAVTFTSDSQLRRRAQISFDVGHDGDDAAISHLVLPIRESLCTIEATSAIEELWSKKSGSHGTTSR